MLSAVLRDVLMMKVLVRGVEEQPPFDTGGLPRQ
jgi:hypothetical protein